MKIIINIIIDTMTNIITNIIIHITTEDIMVKKNVLVTIDTNKYYLFFYRIIVSNMSGKSTNMEKQITNKLNVIKI